VKAVRVDANILLRLFTGEPKAQAARAAALAEDASKGHVLLRVSLITVAEIVWVLHRFYKLPASTIAATLSEFFCSDGVAVESREPLLEALALMAREKVDFADALLAVEARASNEPVASFDADFDRLRVQRYPV
jgi:predicted nucleic-acid-binding protein